MAFVLWIFRVCRFTLIQRTKCKQNVRRSVNILLCPAKKKSKQHSISRVNYCFGCVKYINSMPEEKKKYDLVLRALNSDKRAKC